MLTFWVNGFQIRLIRIVRFHRNWHYDATIVVRIQLKIHTIS